MSYTATIMNAQNQPVEITITENDSKEAIVNDYNQLMKKFNPRYVNIERMRANPGEQLHLKMTVNAPSHYLTSQDDRIPKECSSTTVEMIVYLGYPIKGITARYPVNHYLASPNVFRNGNACIDTWVPFTSSLLTVAEKLVNDIIHNPNVTRYESPANSYMIDWHKKSVKNGVFPTMAPKLLEIVKIPPMSFRRTAMNSNAAAAKLPTRRR